jgi:Ca2+-dependent lipid-binding protein
MRVEISTHAFRLKNVAGFGGGTSDPYAILTQLVPGKPPRVIGRTEVVLNCTSPNWTKVFVVDYDLGTPFSFAVSIFDENERTGDSKPMGSAVFEIGQVLAARGSTKAKSLKGGRGTIFVTARKSTGAGSLRFQLKATKVRNLVLISRNKCTK